jgi:farnesyl-diphosphate farnesyltransferase
LDKNSVGQLRMRSDLLSDLLKEVSRSFYLTLRILPARIRPQIGLAYLLARTTDTIADTGLVPLDTRLASLSRLRDRILGASSTALDFGALAANQSLPAEKILLERAEESAALLDQFSAADQQLIREVLKIITSGQELDLKRFSGSDKEKIIALESDAELDDYTFRVAGCVGDFWTRICHAHLFPQLEIENLVANGIRFGKGLQLINILRDLPRDLRDGRCYIPTPRLAAIGLNPHDLLSPANEARFRPLYNEYVSLAEAHLQAGWNYTNSLPSTHVRLTLACAWPILIGAKTLGRLQRESVLDPDHTIKVPRREVRQIMVRSIALYPFRKAWQSQLCSGFPRN